MTAQLPSKERLEKIASWRETYGAGHNVMLPAEEAEAMARALLAAHEQEPVAYMYRDNLHTDARFSLEPRFSNWSPEDISEYEISETPLYTHSAPVPAVPDEISTTDAMKIMNGRIITMSVHTAYKNGWNACRAAMLNGGKS